MADYLVKQSTLSDIADGIRRITGTTNELTPSQMTEIMSTIEPGSMGTGGSVETCTVTIMSDETIEDPMIVDLEITF